MLPGRLDLDSRAVGLLAARKAVDLAAAFP